MILVTHDLGVVAAMADHVMVMYAGRMVEYADVETIFARPRHPYTRGLLESLIRLEDTRDIRARADPGHAARPVAAAPGCSFAPRCPAAVRGLLREENPAAARRGRPASGRLSFGERPGAPPADRRGMS